MITSRNEKQLRTSLAVFGCLIASMGISRPAAAASITFTTSSATVSGSNGSTVGFGYTIVNNTADFYQPTSLNAGSFSIGTPNSIFDYPEVAPNTTVTESFTTVTGASCPTPDCGLFEIKLTGMAGQSNSGVFDISGELFADQAETMDLGAAPELSQSYGVTVTSSTVTPEPSYFLVFCSILTGLFLARKTLKISRQD